MTSVLLAFAGASSFTVGGMFMKPTHGLTRPIPTAAVVALFALGMYFTARLIQRGGDVGPAYLAVVGLETVLAFVLGVIVFGDEVTPIRLIAVALLLIGTLLLGPAT